MQLTVLLLSALISVLLVGGSILWAEIRERKRISNIVDRLRAELIEANKIISLQNQERSDPPGNLFSEPPHLSPPSPLARFQERWKPVLIRSNKPKEPRELVKPDSSLSPASVSSLPFLLRSLPTPRTIQAAPRKLQKPKRVLPPGPFESPALAPPPPVAPSVNPPVGRVLKFGRPPTARSAESPQPPAPPPAPRSGPRGQNFH